MKRTAVLLLALALAFAAGSWVTWQVASSRATANAEKKVLYFACPMHPQYHSDHAGDCPSCGMRLEPVYSEGAAPAPAAPAGASRLVRITAERQQAIGVRIGVAETTPASQVLRTVGRVAADESRIYRINAAADGWVQEVGDKSTGSIVGKDQRLGSFYSPEFLGAQQALIFAASSRERFEKAGGSQEQLAAADLSIKQASDSLKNLGMSGVQIDAISQSKQIAPQIWIVAPAPGFVLARSVFVGLRFEKGAEFYRIADLSHVWIMADIFENQAKWIKAGAVAHVNVPQTRGEFRARVSDVLPLFDETTRTLKTRLEMDNPGYALRPGMFVDVDFPISLPAALTVPTDAVLDSGLRKLVFVDRGNGYFEPRRVETGWQMGDRVEIVKGLMAGERIVVSGNFLLDSESRMKAGATSVSTSEIDPVCGMEVDRDRATAAHRILTHKDHVHYFCSDDCRKRFAEHPEAFVAK